MARGDHVDLPVEGVLRARIGALDPCGVAAVEGGLAAMDALEREHHVPPALAGLRGEGVRVQDLLGRVPVHRGHGHLDLRLDLGRLQREGGAEGHGLLASHRDVRERLSRRLGGVLCALLGRLVLGSAAGLRRLRVAVRGGALVLTGHRGAAVVLQRPDAEEAAHAEQQARDHGQAADGGIEAGARPTLGQPLGGGGQARGAVVHRGAVVPSPRTGTACGGTAAACGSR